MNIEAPIATADVAPVTATTGQEAAFNLSDLIYSRSDPRGIILFGNHLFTQISEYDWEELEGAPHKLLRNPDMPKGLFWLFWNRLKAGQPMGAYIKNRTKSGKHYWVYALVTPSDDGYMSIRMKPSTDMLAKMQRIYADLLQQETADKRSDAEAGAQALLARLQEMGFKDYDSFMAQTLEDEMASRNRKLGRVNVVQRTSIRDLVKLANEAESLLVKMSTGFQNIRAEPVNMRILSNRLEGGGGPISSIAQNYEVMAKEMGDDLAQLEHGDIGVFDAIRKASSSGHFAVLAADLADECLRILTDAAKAGEDQDDVLASETRIMTVKAAALRDEANGAIRMITERSSKLLDSCRSLRRRVNGLDVVKLMCRVESGRLENFDASLLGIIDRLDRFHGEIDSCLAQVAKQAMHINRIARSQG